MNLTKEAAEGFDAAGLASAACPYLATSAAAMAWHLGRFLAQHRDWRDSRPTPEAKPRDHNRIAITSGRGDTLNVRGRCDALVARFRWHPDNTFSEVR